jgi:hypothetical protein
MISQSADSEQIAFISGYIQLHTGRLSCEVYNYVGAFPGNTARVREKMNYIVMSESTYITLIHSQRVLFWPGRVY